MALLLVSVMAWEEHRGSDGRWSLFIPQFFIADPSQAGYAAHQAGTGELPSPPP